MTVFFWDFEIMFVGLFPVCDLIHILEIPSRAVVLSLWVVDPFGSQRPFHRGHRRPLESKDIYITIQSSKMIVMKQ